MNYLKYIERSAENLQFYLWFQDYSARFEKLPESEKALAPAWTKAQAEASSNMLANKPSKKVSQHVAEVLKDTDFAENKPKPMNGNADPFQTPDKSPSFAEKRDSMSEYGSSTIGEKTTASSTMYQASAGQAFEDAGMKWKPCMSPTRLQYEIKANIVTVTTQPYRAEIDRIISIYIADASPRQLNLSGQERIAVMHALQKTTHPSAFQLLATSVEYSLRYQSHPNFVRWTICNGNRPRVVFARGLGVAGILGGFLADLLITLSSVSRPWRVLPFLGWFIGISTLIAAWKGMCVVLHGMHHRHIRPWELFADETDEILDEKAMSQESLTSLSANSFEDEPWVARYKKRFIIRKIFDREVWIKEPALRQIQDTIFLQAILGAFVISAIVVGIFCAVPRGNFY